MTSREVNNESPKCDEDDLFRETIKELSKWENIEKCDAKWDIVVHKNKLAQR